MKATFKSTAICICVFISLLSVAAVGQCKNDRGTWTAKPSEEHSDQLQINVTCSKDIGSVGRPLSLGELQGLDPAAVSGKHVAVKFRLAREAGLVQFEGIFNQGIGYGEFTFTANQDFLAAMTQMGYPGARDKAFLLTMLDMTRAYTQELGSLGFKPELDKLIEARIFNINREQVSGLAAVGVTGLPLQKLVEYRIFNVNPQYVQEIRAAFPGISLDKMTEMRIHDVTPAFAEEMARLGYSGLSADQLVQFRIFNVNADQVQGLAHEGYKDLRAEDLVTFRIHNIDPAFIQTVKKAGYTHASPSELVEFRIMGIRRRTAGL